MASYDLKQLPPARSYEFEERSSFHNADDVHLTRLGKRPVLKRNFGLMSMLGFSCTILITWESVTTGGPAGSVYGYILVWIGVAATFVVMSELVSMAPTSGGQYHWCSMLAPSSSMKLFSYITGWTTVVGWQATYASVCYLGGMYIETIAMLTHPSYEPKIWRQVLIGYAIAFFGFVLNIAGGKVLPRFEGAILILHILGFFAVLVPMVYLSNHNTAEQVFTEFLNEGQWPTQGLSFFIGIIGHVFSFAGGDAAVHLSEEITNATVAVPCSLMLTVLINGVLGFSMLIALLFSVENYDAALAARVPFLRIFLDATGSVAGTTAAGCIMVIMGTCSSAGMLASTSRQFWSFARDRGIPGWRVWTKVTPHTAIPTYAVILTVVITCLLSLIGIGSDVAFNNLMSLSTAGLCLSYLITGSLLLWRRCTGGISASKDEHTIINTAGAQLVWGPFHVPGIWGILINIVALIYLVVAIFFSFWPPMNNVTVESMNYSSVGLGGVIFLSLIYYLVRARKVYKGPIVELHIG
ncbi:amino acid/polyamine transporter I [Aspergillus alliaceus]|uniref:amino acid/polyamine transporter I n=1 Tax=Petromyces alliaceus TaxID=209559 RepID=UPI0012A5B56C|nr:amino acid/polyamine transporter I [Aspergillus alliaceus]KAB8236438.1 amino acid/polyamine transporter I [Aspergillus alliaceus]